ncbi:hypothetical protein GCM10023310_70730 [Paenibacillus vulneris]
MALNYELTATATKRAYKVIKLMENGFNAEEFEYEFSNLYTYPDYPMLEIDSLYEYYKRK